MTTTDLPAELTDSLPLDDYLSAVQSALDPFGFTPDATLAAVSICRDELTQHLSGAVARRWGAPFSLGGLGGIPTLGRTGWGACLAHVPTEVDRGKLLVICLAHIGVEPEAGLFVRPGQRRASATCGAAAALLAGWADAGAQPAAHEDNEAAMLRSLVEQGADEAPGSIVELTMAIAAAALTEARRQVEAASPWDSMDVALLGGVQVHAPGGDLVLPVGGQYRTGPDEVAELEIG
ncbi:MAG: hypothetical protein GY812_07375 [Actinomycetia bacterium]|nr:hypothetical protein [Actinomycetes bacterium]